MGGSWLGVLAVDEESAANTLATSEAAWEITQEKFDELKKKRMGVATAQGFMPSRMPQLPPQPLEAAASPAARRSDSASEAPTAAAGRPLVSVALPTTNQKPPHEPLLEVGLPKRRKAT